MLKRRLFLISCVLVLFGVVACSASQSAVEEGKKLPPTTKITLLTHDSFNVTTETLEAFSAESGLTIEIVRGGDAGAMVNQAILSKNNPLADVIFGVDNTFLSRALDAEIFLPYQSPLSAELNPDLAVDPQFRVLPVDYGDVCLNYDKGWFAEKGIAPPNSLESLIAPAYRGLSVVENPATSSPGLAFLLATVSYFGKDNYLQFWEKLAANDLRVESGWEEAYYQAFTRYGGDRPIVVSYASSPPAEVIYAETPIIDSVTASVVADGSCFRQIEYAGILKGTKNVEAAQKLIDFLLSIPFQEDIPLSMFVFPANKSAKLPPVFTQHATIPAVPAKIDSAEIETYREEWIQAWTKTVLR